MARFKLTNADRQAIREAVRRAENVTSGELVTVIAPAADDYAAYTVLWSTFVALVLPGAGWLLLPFASVAGLYVAQLLIFCLLVVLLQKTPLRYAVVPSRVKRARAARLARECFYNCGVYQTRGHTGILLFVSVAEHHVEIIADAGIYDRVSHNVWTQIVDHFVADVRAGQVRDGFEHAIARCGELLHEEFPKPPGNLNELPDHLIEL